MVTKILPEYKQKLCSSCGMMTGSYVIYKNACICNDCNKELKLVEIKPKKIPNEKNMLTKILEKSQKELK